jgi:hypothetical protein
LELIATLLENFQSKARFRGCFSTVREVVAVACIGSVVRF